MRVLVTGATGFIGGHAARALVAAGHAVVALVRDRGAKMDLAGAEVARGDLADVASLAAACRGVDAVVHAAAVVQGHGRWEDFRVGVEGTHNLIAAMGEAGVKRLVHVSSLGVYGLASHPAPIAERARLSDRPESWNHYVRQKVLAEKAVWQASERGAIEPVVLRAAATLGPGDRASLPSIFAALRAGKMAILGPGGNRVPFVVVEDLARAIAAAVSSPSAVGRAYNISGAAPVTQAEFLDVCARALGLDPPARHVPIGVAKLVAALAEWHHQVRRRAGAPPMTRLGIAVATCDLLVDCTAAGRDLAWTGDASYEDAVRREVTWLGEPT